MEPQLFSCGLHEMCTYFFTLDFAFNGAATFQLRIASSSGTHKDQFCTLQWSRNFSVADCEQIDIQLKNGLNPSMEPQLFSCGLNEWVGDAKRVLQPFNGAATFQLRIASLQFEDYKKSCLLQWSRNFSVADWGHRHHTGHSPISFNGAATFQLRIAECTDRVDRIPGLLQWSRNFSVADCCWQKTGR